MITMIGTLSSKGSYKFSFKVKWQHLLSFYLSIFLLITPHATQAADTLSINSMATVNQITQDKKGFIWLSSQNGLTRFDGEQIIIFDSSNTTWPLPFNWLHDISIDNEHLLLATEKDGLWRFNPETGEATKVPTSIPRQSHYNVTFFQGDYFINAPDNLYRYHTNTKTTTLIQSDISIREIKNTKKHLYISSQSGLYQLKNNTLIKILNEPISALTALSSSIIAITKSSITRINDDGSQVSIKKANNIDAATKEYNTNNFFTVNNQGVINKLSGETLQPTFHKFENIKPTRVRSFFHDNSGVLWVTSNRGVEQLTENNIKNYPKTFNIKINANEIITYKDEIIIGSYGAGLQNFTSDIFLPSVNDAFSQSGLRISAMINVNHTLYIATFDGLWQYNAEENKVERLNFPENNKLILELKHYNNRLYLATNYNGAYVYDIATEKVINHISPEEGLSSPEVIGILPLNNGYTWLATSATVDIVNNHTNNIRNLSLPGNKKVISLLRVEDKVFASTLGDGIYAFNLQGELLAQFGQGKRFSQMRKVNDDIWVTARPGLYRFNPDNYQLSMIENTEPYTFVGSMVVKNNMLYASHYSGVLSLDLTTKEKLNPKVHISKTTVSGQSYLLNKAIKINSGNDVITLDLASLDYRPGVNKQYKYTLNGNQWHQINGNQLTLTGLASGDYHIEIMATNSLGQWSNYKAYTEINVAFPWYWTPQMRLIYSIGLLCIILLCAWLLYLRSKSINHIHAILQKDISNYDKTSIQVKRNLSAALSFISENEIVKGKTLIQQCIDDFDKQQTLAEPNSLSGNTLNDAIPFLAQYLERKYQVKLTYQFELNESELNYELQADLYRVIYEAITSAILSDNGRNFKVVLQKFKNKIWLNISDDSQSFIHFNSKINFNISTYYIRQIANKHKGSINTFNEQGNASQFILSLPIMHGN